MASGYDATAPGGPDQGMMDHDRKAIDESTLNLRLEEMANHILNENKSRDEKFTDSLNSVIQNLNSLTNLVKAQAQVDPDAAAPGKLTNAPGMTNPGTTTTPGITTPGTTTATANQSYTGTIQKQGLLAPKHLKHTKKQCKTIFMGAQEE